MALSATMHRFAIELSDVDRGVYEALDVRAARHPSESLRVLMSRGLAFCAEWVEGIEFGRGVSTPDEPTIWVKDAVGTITTWIEVGSPSVDRLHRASKTGARVRVYAHKDPGALLEDLAKSPIHRQSELEIVVVPEAVIRPLEEAVERNEKWNVTIAEGHLYVQRGNESFDGQLYRPELG